MDRNEALQLLHHHLTDDRLVKHCLATEAIMRSLARRFSEDEELWALAGLLHDLDFIETRNTPENHSLRTLEILSDKCLPEELLLAIKEHNAEALGIERSSRFGIALASAETITGLIVATALVMPDKKLQSVRPRSIRKRMKEKAFAKSVNREIIRECEKIDVPLDEFISLSLSAMQNISSELGL